MSIPKFNPRSAALFIFILAVGVLRILATWGKDLSPLCNFTPIGAMALFGGAYFSNSWKAVGFPLLTLFIGDLILSFTIFSQYRTGLLYTGWYWTYIAFALMVLAGKFFIKKVSLTNVLLGSLVCVLIHWIITDIGAWQMGILYPKTFAGYIECLIAAIPYEGRFLEGTLLYSAILFGLFEWMQKRYTSLRLAA
ncbi:DUF6580 family putative transport protein [Flavitalea flava]